MTPPAAAPVEAFTIPGGRAKLTPKQWREIEQHLEAWKQEVLAAARRHPARSYRLGVAQIEAFADLLGNLNAAAGAAAHFGGVSPTSANAMQWARTYTLRELDDALNVYIGRIKDALLYGLRGAMSPTAVASLLYNATQDARVNWRRIARTEMARANAAGRLDAIADMGYDRVWCPPHMGSCRHCKRILENNVFRLDDVRDATNFGNTNPKTWIACCPLHPHCRHGWLPYEPEVYQAMQAQYRALEDAGLDERALDELFDSSGQLAEGAEDDPRLQAWLDAQKIDPHAELLALAVLKVTRPVDVAKRAPREEWLPIDELRTDLYQRAPDPHKILAMHAALRRGEDLPKPKVSRREDGTTWVYDGQHRVHARRLHGEYQVLCDVREGMDWPGEADACREAIAKLLTWDAATDDLLPPEPVVVKDTLDAQLWGAAEPILPVGPAPEPTLDPTLFDGLRLRDDVGLALEQWWQLVTDDPDWHAWSRLRIPAGARRPVVLVDYQALREHRPEWRRLADADLHLALVAATIAAARARELAPGIGLEPLIVNTDRPVDLDSDGPAGVAAGWDVTDQAWIGGVPDGSEQLLEKTLPGYTWSAGSDSGPSHAAGLLPLDLADRLVDGDELAKAVHDVSAEPRDERGRWSDDGHKLHFSPGRKAARTQAWGRGLVTANGKVVTWPEDDGITHAQMIRAHGERESDAGTFIIRHDGWTKFYGRGTQHDHVDRALAADDRLWTDENSHRLIGKTVAPQDLDVVKLAYDGDELDVAKLAVKANAANVDVEHWITIHPHGDDEKGQPVLVRNNADGSMTVIGGAGGNLNMMRLDPSRRVDRGEDGKPKGASGGGKVEQAVTEAEAEEKQREREQQIAQARDALEQVKQQRLDRQQQLHDYLREHLDVDLDDAELDHKQRQKLMKKLRTSAMRTLAYGPIQRRDVAEAPTPEQLDEDSPDAPQPWIKDDSDQVAENDSQEARKPRPQVAMGEEDAKAVLDALLDLRELQGIGSKHRRVINGEERGADALQIDWSEGTDEKRDQRRAKAVEQQLRTDLSRELAQQGDKMLRAGSSGKRNYDQRFKQAHAQGGFDSLDAFCHSIVGEAVLSKEAYNLLGVAGAAQLVAHTIQERALELGKQGLDLTKVQQALKDLTDEQERSVNERGLNRMHRALRRAGQAYTELGKSERGEGSLYTTTMARSIGAEKTQEAKRGLGMMIGGLEACSAMKTALDRKAGEKIKVGGFSSPATIKQLAERARIKIGSGDIVRVGAGNYTLSIDPEKLQGLVRPEGRGNVALRERLEHLRTADDFDAEVQTARRGPGMTDVLDANQAKGKLFLQAAGSGVLAFDPGVGKTHTAIAAAMEKMAAEPGKHRALIVCPGNVSRSWANTIRSQGPDYTCDLVGEHDTNPLGEASTKKKYEQLGGTGHFTVVSYDTLKGANGQKILQQLADEGRSHSLVIADELQMGKDEKSERHKGVEKAVDHARNAHGDDSAFWGLTGTPIEKNVTDLHAMQKLVKRAKGQAFADRKTHSGKFGRLGQDEHIARGDKIREFRKGLDEDLFRLTAADAGNDLGKVGRSKHKVELDDDHKQQIQAAVDSYNHQNAEYHRKKAEGLEPGKPPEFGGRRMLLDALYGKEDSALVKQAADIVDGLGTFDFKGMPTDHEDGKYAKGDHAGTYHHKAVVFGASENSRALFGLNAAGNGFDPEGKGGVAGELRKRGVQVFVGHGAMGGDAKNEASYKAFLAHKGKAVFVTNDKNNAGISLQFGDNKGAFQHGATHMVHFTRPVNNATIQQREARILRKGAMARFEHEGKSVGAAYHTISADTPVEQRLEETLEREARTQDLAANSEQQVAGSDTLAHHLAARGVKVPE